MLPPRVAGQSAELVREAESKQRDGDLVAAAELLERAIEHGIIAQGALPAWACGRLAAIYRSLSRYDDEVALLERYCESSVTDDAKTRFVARLSKARAIAERRRRLDNGALKTVKEAKSRLRTRRTTAREATLRAAHLMLDAGGETNSLSS
jgi:HD superfamily phosphodiesterase